MHACDVVIWVWPVFITFTPDHRAMGRKREESGTQLKEQRMKPYFIYFEGTPGLLARDYARFPNPVLWKLAEKVREVVAAGKVVRIEDDLGSHLTATYDGTRLYGMQFRAGDPPGRCHFPWGRCGVFNGSGKADGEVYLSCVQGVSGALPAPMKWVVKDSEVVEAEGGELAEECRQLFKNVPGSNRHGGDHVRLSPQGVHPPRHRRPHALGAHQQDAVGGPGHRPQAPRLPTRGRLGDERPALHRRPHHGARAGHARPLASCTIPKCWKRRPPTATPTRCSPPVSHNAHGSGTLW